MPQTKTRVVGSGFTTFNYKGTPIAWLEGFDDSGQALTPAQPEPITPLGNRWPVEFATSRVMAAGGLTMLIRELWNQPVWQTIPDLAQARNMAEVQDALAADPTAISAQMVITPPGPNTVARGKTYHDVLITGIDDAEQVRNGSLTIGRQITAVYTHYTLFP